MTRRRALTRRIAVSLLTVGCVVAAAAAPAHADWSPDRAPLAGSSPARTVGYTMRYSIAGYNADCPSSTVSGVTPAIGDTTLVVAMAVPAATCVGFGGGQVTAACMGTMSLDLTTYTMGTDRGTGPVSLDNGFVCGFTGASCRISFRGAQANVGTFTYTNNIFQLAVSNVRVNAIHTGTGCGMGAGAVTFSARWAITAPRLLAVS